MIKYKTPDLRELKREQWWPVITTRPPVLSYSPLLTYAAAAPAAPFFIIARGKNISQVRVPSDFFAWEPGYYNHRTHYRASTIFSIHFQTIPPPSLPCPVTEQPPQRDWQNPFSIKERKKRVQGDLKGNKGVSSKDIWHSSHKNVKGDRPFILFVLIPQRFKVCTHRKDNNNMNFRSVFLTAIKKTLGNLVTSKR